MKKALALAILAVGMLASQIVLGKKQPKRPQAAGSEIAKAPATAQSLANPYAGKPDALQAGKKLYGRYCAQCHGPEARGRGEAPPLRSPAVREARPGALFWFLKNGDLKQGMPSWSRLPDPQLWQLVSFLQSLE